MVRATPTRFGAFAVRSGTGAENAAPTPATRCTCAVAAATAAEAATVAAEVVAGEAKAAPTRFGAFAIVEKTGVETGVVAAGVAAATHGACCGAFAVVERAGTGAAVLAVAAVMVRAAATRLGAFAVRPGMGAESAVLTCASVKWRPRVRSDRTRSPMPRGAAAGADVGA
ncbi:hypothetical protein T492DRAFT_850201 [Pavlovales sp. CCMP2436]|nr:hypothetical protein T492DRAFT_850201 [Pavlovales sp. CCMP2436]